jgi:molecular chaperone GrpE (heat shock protein)
MKKIIVVAVLVVVAFLLGFVPPYAKARRLDNELRMARQQNKLAQLRDLAGLAYVQANQKNYGLAAATCSQFFARAAETENEVSDQANRKALESLLAVRDKITTELAKGDPGVLNDLQDLFLKTRQATTYPGG